MRFHTSLRQLAALQIGRSVIAYLAHITGLEPPVLAGGQSTGYLAPREDLGGDELHFCVEGREVRQLNQSVGSV